MAENPTAGLTQEEEEDNIDYDSDGNPIPSTTKKIILPLPPIDHSEVTLKKFDFFKFWGLIFVVTVVSIDRLPTL